MGSIYKDVNNNSSNNGSAKIVLRKVSGTDYRIISLNITSNRPKRKATENAKYVFNESLEEQDDSVVFIANNYNPALWVRRFKTHEITQQTQETKMKIAKNQPTVKIEHSIPFPVALIEEGTNKIHSKGLLLNHLFHSFEARCILCPLCKLFYSVTTFATHVNIDEQVSENGDEKIRCREQLNRTSRFQIVPYKTNFENESDLLPWKIFSERFIRFRRDKTQTNNPKSRPKLSKDSKVPNSNLATLSDSDSDDESDKRSKKSKNDDCDDFYSTAPPEKKFKDNSFAFGLKDDLYLSEDESLSRTVA